MNDSLATILIETIKSANSESFDYFGVFLSAFGGAFFAFVFLKISEFLNNSHNINLQNISSLNKIQLMMNEHLDLISGNIYNINEFSSQIKKAQTEKFTLISPNQPSEIQFDDSIIINLNNEYLINELLSYKMKLYRCNSDSLSINKLVEFHMTALQQKAISSDSYMKNLESSDSYMKNLEICAKKYENIKKALESLNKKTKTNLAITRIRLKKDKPSILGKFNLFIKGRNNENNFSSLIENELNILDKEINEVTAKSKEYISNIGVEN